VAAAWAFVRNFSGQPFEPVLLSRAAVYSEYPPEYAYCVKGPPMASDKLIWMPWYYPDFLADTTQLDAALTGAYMLLIGEEFFHGPLPNDPVRLCRIAKLNDTPSMPKDGGLEWGKGGDTPSITQVFAKYPLGILLSSYFTQLPDGTWSQKRVASERVKALERRRVNRERAVKAITIRWNKYRKKREDEEKKSDTPSITQVVLKNYQSQSYVKAKTKAGGSLRSPLPNGTALVAPRGGSVEPWPAAGSKPNPKSAKRAKTIPTAPGAAEQGREDVSPTRRPSARASAAVKGLSGHPVSATKPQNGKSGVDPRFEPFRREIFEYWEHQNLGDKKAGQCPWAAKDQAALLGLLRVSPEMTLETFRALLMNRAHSDVLPCDAPRNWLAELKRFAAGPLDRYKQPLRALRTM
jgi:uncharacterized protein YdaU (DUF1376 family)